MLEAENISSRGAKHPSRGLVLAGGGAKGAYEFGCLVGLKRLGYHFEVVAGTSVGALNAALWSTGSLVKGFSLWRELSFSNTLPVTLAGRFTPKWLLWFVSSIQVAIHLIIAVVERRKHPATKPIAAGLAAMCALLNYSVFVSLCMISQRSAEVHWIFAAVVAAGFGHSLFKALVKQDEEANFQFFIGLFLATYVGSIIGVGLPLAGDVRGRFGPMVGVAVAAFLTLIGWTIIFLVCRFAYWLSKPLRILTVFSSNKLRNHIQQIVANGWRCPTIACHAVSTDVVDSSEGIEWVSAYGEDSLRADIRSLDDNTFKKRAVRPRTKRVWWPRYVVVSDEPAEDAVAFLLASAALPFGLSPPVHLLDEPLVDGGIEDNVPWFPVIEYDVDEVIVIVLEDFATEDDALRSLNVSTDAWLKRKLALNSAWNGRQARNPVLPEETHEAEAEIRVVDEHFAKSSTNIAKELILPRIRVIFPREDLGGMVGGTLKFDRDYAEHLIRQGIRDVKDRFSKP